jgi:hypothetical protein
MNRSAYLPVGYRVDVLVRAWISSNRSRIQAVACTRADQPTRAIYTDCWVMRRAVAISLMLLFSWTLIAPMLASDTDANLPACCRRNGKHHCTMRRMQQSGGRQGFTTVADKCPYTPASACAVYSPTYKPGDAAAVHGEIVYHPSCAPQPLAHALYSRHRCHPKRGPPTPLA